MMAAVFYGKHDLRYEETVMPQVGKNDVLVEVKACGICGTDIHIFEGDEGCSPTPAGTVLGHEFSGVVAQIGENVKSVKVGDRVCVDPNKLCNECYYCKNALGHFCSDMIGIGTGVNGGFAEFCSVPESQLYKVPSNCSFEEAAMTEPVSCCLHGIDMCDINCGDTVLIMGGGMIGLIMLQLAKLKGAAKIILSEPVKEKCDHAKRLGADICIDPINEDIKEVLNKNGVERISAVIECVGRPETMSEAISLAGKKSTVMFFGLSKPDDVIPVKPFEIFKKEITIKSSYINPYTMERALKLIASGKVDVSSMIYKVAPLSELNKILSDKKLRLQGKYIIKP